MTIEIVSISSNTCCKATRESTYRDYIIITTKLIITAMTTTIAHVYVYRALTKYQALFQEGLSALTHLILLLGVVKTFKECGTSLVV